MESKDKMVTHPTHYQSSNGIECIQAIEAATEELQGVEAVCTANAIKYLWRWKKKNGKQDLEKAKWYIDHLIKKLNKEVNLVTITASGIEFKDSNGNLVKKVPNIFEYAEQNNPVEENNKKDDEKDV